MSGEMQVAVPRAETKGSSVSIVYPILTKNNYAAWAIKMKIFMEAQGVWDVVEPAEGVEVDRRMDRMAMAAIYQGISEDALLTIAEKNSAKAAWEALKTMHLGADRVKNARIQTLKGEFEVLRMKDSESIDDFSMRLSAIINKVRTLGETMDEAYVVKKFLRAMPRKFISVVSIIEQFGDLETMSLEEIIGRLKTHEERIRGEYDSEDASLLLTREEWQARTRNYGGGRSREPYEDGKRITRDKSKVRCFNCDMFGHFASECRKPRRNREEEVNLVEEEEPMLLMGMCMEDTQTTIGVIEI